MSHPPGSVSTMSETEALLQAEGITSSEVFHGPAEDCPICTESEAPGLAA